MKYKVYGRPELQKFFASKEASSEVTTIDFFDQSGGVCISHTFLKEIYMDGDTRLYKVITLFEGAYETELIYRKAQGYDSDIRDDYLVDLYGMRVGF